METSNECAYSSVQHDKSRVGKEFTYKYAYDCAQPWYIIQPGTVLTIFPSYPPDSYHSSVAWKRNTTTYIRINGIYLSFCSVLFLFIVEQTFALSYLQSLHPILWHQDNVVDGKLVVIPCTQVLKHKNQHDLLRYLKYPHRTCYTRPLLWLQGDGGACAP